MEHSKGNPTHIWDQHKQQSTGWLSRNYCKQEPWEEVQEAWVTGRQQWVGAGLIEKTFAVAHFKSKYSRALDGSNQGKKQASS